MITKVCRDCQTEKPAEDFPVNKKTSTGLGTYCRKCQQARTMASPNYRANVRKAQLKRNYGITPERYDLLFDRQEGVCAICKLPEDNRDFLSIDHNHETGAIRGLLCHTCNVGLGKFKDSPELLSQAIWYLKMYENNL